MVSFVQQGIATIFLYGIFGLGSLAAWLLVRSTFHRTSAVAAAAIGSAIAGPILIGVILWLTMWVAPGQSTLVYVVTCVLVPVMVIALNVRAAFEDTLALRTAIRNRGLLWTWLLIAVGLLAVPLLLLPQLLLLPLGGNDPLEYMQLGRAFFEARDPGAYPYLTSEQTGGFIAPWTHPPTYGVLITLAYMLQGSAEVAGAAKMIGLWFATGTAAFCGAMVYMVDRGLSMRVVAAPLLVFTVPLYFQLVQSAHIDSLRIASFTLAAGMATFAVSQGTMAAAAVAGVAISLALLSHSIGILAPLIVLPLVLITWQRGVMALLRTLVVIGVVITVLGLPYYVRNIWIFGNPIQDSVPTWELQYLGISDFLRTSRGLETFMDRMYHGALLPFTRVNEFGWLPDCLLLFGFLLLVKRLRQGAFPFLARIVDTRQSNTLTQFALFVMGFFALMLLTVFAGSDLAVKNSRYLLTVLPVSIVLLLIVLGRLLPDERGLLSLLKHLAMTPSRWLRRLLPGRAVDAAVESNKGLTLLRPFAGALLMVALLGGALLHQVYHALRVSYSNTVVYIGIKGISWSRIGESEWMKRDGSALADAALERETRRLVKPGQSVLVFRQASFGFFKVAPFRFFLERNLAHLFEADDARSLWKQLHEAGLSWLYVPYYPLAEIQNSSFAPLLLDPTLIRPARKIGDWMLYEVLPSESDVDLLELGSALPYVLNGRSATATTESGGGQIDGRSASLTLDPSSGSAELVRHRGAIKQLDRWDAIVSRPMKTRVEPESVNAVDFELGDEGLILLTATLSGHGLAEVAVEYSRWDTKGEAEDDSSDQNLFPMQEDLSEQVRESESFEKAIFPIEGDLSKQYPTVVQRDVVWSGTLSSERRTVGGWLMPVPTMTEGNRTRGGRLIFRLRDGDSMRVYRWSATAVHYRGLRTPTDVVRDAIRQGWVFRGEHSLIEGDFQFVEAIDSEGKATRDYALERPTTAPIMLSPPIHRLDSTVDATHLAHLVSDDALALHVEATVFGSGQVIPQLAYVCRRNTSAGDNAYLLSMQRMSLVSAPDLRRVQSAPLQPMYLHAGISETAKWSVRVPCVPSAARLLLNSRFSRLETPEKTAEDPNGSKKGSVGVKDVLMKLGPLGSGSRVSPISLSDA